MTRTLLVPGLYNSDPDHWQSRWEAGDETMERVIQDDWETPHCADWVARLDQDPFVTVGRAQTFARAWGSEFVMIGEAGHINTASGLGDWHEGLALLRNLCETQQLKPRAARREPSLRVL